jgi:hypothetical protein
MHGSVALQTDVSTRLISTRTKRPDIPEVAANSLGDVARKTIISDSTG